MFNEIYSLRSKKLKENGYSDYQEYLKSDEWKTIKNSIKQRKGARWNLCNLCTSPNNLEVHHSSYKVIGTINPHNTVKMLCRSCHQEVHDYCKKYPQYNLYRACNRIKKIRKRNGLPIWNMKLVNEYNSNNK